MTQPKRHHFVPQMLLRRFTDDNGQLHFFDKRFPEKGVLSSSPVNVFVERDLYTQHGKDGDRDTSVETMLSDLEGDANKIIEKITTAARLRRLPVLTPSEKEAWDQYVFYQWKRVPDVQDRIFEKENFEGIMRDSLDEYEAKYRPLTAEEASRMSDPEELARFKQNAWALSVARRGEEVVEILREKGLAIALIGKPTKSFIVGSYPVLKLNYPGRAHLKDPTVELWLPIAHDIAVVPGFDRGIEQLFKVPNDRMVRNVNENIFKQSTAIAGRSRALIESLTGV